MKHSTSPSFWDCFDRLPKEVQAVAQKNFTLLRNDPDHPSLQLKKAGRYLSVRIGKHYRSLSVEVPEGLLRFWIGTHAEYDRLVR